VSSAQSTGLDSEVTVQGVFLFNEEWQGAYGTPMLCNAPVWRGLMVWIWRLNVDTLFSVKKIWLERPTSYTMVSIKTWLSNTLWFKQSSALARSQNNSMMWVLFLNVSTMSYMKSLSIDFYYIQTALMKGYC